MFRFREVEAPTAPSPPALFSGSWRLLQLRRRRFLSPGGEGSLSLASPALGVSVCWIGFGSRLWLVCGSGFVVHGFVQSDELSIGSMKLSEVKTKHGSEEMVSMEALR
ncbi:hypothetical protein YC2023_015473 [Brassica napus]|uniref:Uncharacterized protein n=1 Tax=Brassica oleracea TaxID=3712 RepID=A0A3P6DHA4_BRAOL|nr:unnamed protein product [Brassica oleracea]